MRKSYVQIGGVLYEKGTEPQDERIAPDVMGDIQPYRSMITGEMITSRSQHREHLKAHGMVEVGNDSSLYQKPTGLKVSNPEQIREILRAQVNDMTHEQWKRAGKKDLDNWKWNSRQD